MTAPVRLTSALGTGETTAMLERWIPEDAEADALRALRAELRAFDALLFAKRMPRVSLAFTDARAVLGRWVPDRGLIEMNRGFVCTAPWLETLEVLKHEMAHAYVDAVLRPVDEGPHGVTFQRLCEQLGIDGRGSGAVDVPAGPSAVLRRVEKLLALGQSSERNEAEAAMRRAQAILRAHNLKHFEAAKPATYHFRQLGPSRSRIDGLHRGVAHILSRHFFVEVIWIPAFVPGRSRMGSALEVSGTPDNLEVAAYVHDFLVHTGEHLWRRHRADTGASGHGRRRFQAGVMMGFDEKLEGGLDEASVAERALVAAGDSALSAYLRRRHPRIVRSRSGGLKNDELLRAGKAAGRSIVLRKGVTSSNGNSGKLLPG